LRLVEFVANSRLTAGKNLWEAWVMDRQVDGRVKINRWLLAAIACVALTADASLAAGRHGKSTPRSGGAVSHEVTAGDHAPKSETGAAGVEPVHDAARPGGKPDASAHGIDLVRHDDGYINLRRRATRSTLIAAKTKLPIGLPVVVAPHPPSPPGAAGEPLKNSTGVNTVATKPNPVHTGPAPVVPVNAGLAKNSVGLSVSDKHPSAIHVTATGGTAPVTGINGTTMGHHPGIGGIGGPAKERSATSGSSFHK
jgi:hypothetical protein